MRIWKRSQVFEPSPQGVLRVVIRRIFVGIRTGPFTRRFCFFAPLIKSAQTAKKKEKKKSLSCKMYDLQQAHCSGLLHLDLHISCIQMSYENTLCKWIKYLLTPWCRVLLEKLTGLQLVKKFPAFHGTRRFITALTSIRHLSPTWAGPIQSIYPNPTSRRFILILSTHLCLAPPVDCFLQFPHQDPIHPPLLTHTCHTPSPSHSSRFYHPHNIGWRVQII